MAERVLQHTATIPAGTPASAPVTVALGFHDWDVEAIELEVPPGPAGNLGFYLANNGNPWIPRSSGEWLIWDDHKQLVYATGYPTGTGWQIVGYNTGQYDHAVITRFHVNAVKVGASSSARTVITFVESDVPERETIVL